MANPRQYKIPDWFLNRQKDIKDGKYGQVTSNQLENKLREDLERLKKIRAHRGLRHYWGYINLIGSFILLESFANEFISPSDSESAVNTPKPLVVVDALLVYQRRREVNTKLLP